MIIWIDAQLSPGLASWITSTFQIEARSLRDLGLRDAADNEILNAAIDAGAVVMTKDSDFVKLQQQKKQTSQIIWITCGNTSNLYLRNLLTSELPKAIALLEAGVNVAEISGR